MSNPDTTRPLAMPDDAPDYMAPAWIGCMSWAIGNDEIRSTFEAETGHHHSAAGQSPTTSYVEAFVSWANVHVWGQIGDQTMTDSTTEDDIETIRRLIDLASFTTSETLLSAKFRADEAIDRIEAALRKISHEH